MRTPTKNLLGVGLACTRSGPTRILNQLTDLFIYMRTSPCRILSSLAAAPADTHRQRVVSGRSNTWSGSLVVVTTHLRRLSSLRTDMLTWSVPVTNLGLLSCNRPLSAHFVHSVVCRGAFQMPGVRQGIPFTLCHEGLLDCMHDAWSCTALQVPTAVIRHVVCCST